MFLTPHIPNRAGLRPIHRKRFGGAAVGLVVTFSVLGVLVSAAAVVSPRFLQASAIDATSQEVTARTSQHQQMIETLGSLISRSREVMAIHDRGATPFVELVLWLEDTKNPGRIDPYEIAVISHSEVLHAIYFYSLDEPDEEQVTDSSDDAAVQPASDWSWLSDVRRPSFCALWRDRPDIRQRILAVGVSQMVVNPGERSDSDNALLRISLTWADDSADGADEASVLTDVVLRLEGDA